MVVFENNVPPLFLDLIVYLDISENVHAYRKCHESGHHSL